MQPLFLHQFHQAHGAQFTDLNGAEAVEHYGDWLGEYEVLRSGAGILDLSFRSRLCLAGADRVRFLHGQVTNDIKALRVGTGCYAALVNAKGRMESDLNIFCLEDELLLDFEPGIRGSVAQRLEKYIVADDVQVVDVAPLYGLLSVQGPAAAALLSCIGGPAEQAAAPLGIGLLADATPGEIYVANHQRFAGGGFDLFVPQSAMAMMVEKLMAAGGHLGARLCGWRACETLRIELGIARFGADMDATNFPQEAGIESRAVSYSKGCYIGQEVLNRIHTMGHVNRELCGLRWGDGLRNLPQKGDRLFQNDKEVGMITSATKSPRLGAQIALGYVRREVRTIGTSLALRTATEQTEARIVALPFQ
jgi:folate-binding protein YgfZ